MKISSGLFVALTILICSDAHAAVTVNFNQVGNNVVSTASGTINTSLGIFYFEDEQLPASINPNEARLQVGSGYSDIYLFDLQNRPAFGTGNYSTATSSQGAIFGFDANERFFGVTVQTGYVSGTLITSSSQYENSTISSLGLTPGTYIYNFGSGASADIVTLNITPPAVPEPASWAMLILGMGTVGYVMRRRQKIRTRVSYAA